MFVESGEFFWNSGIFLWSVKSILEALHNYTPDLTSTFDNGLATFGTPEENAFIQREFPGCVNISIDYAVMERASNVAWNVSTSAGRILAHGRHMIIRPEPRLKCGSRAARFSPTTLQATYSPCRATNSLTVNGLHDYIVWPMQAIMLLVCPKSRAAHKAICQRCEAIL